jgi:hypothetical protein
MPEIWERAPSMQETSTVGPLGGDAKDLRAPIINERNVMADPLEGGPGDPGAPTINARNIDGGPLVR